jgi:transcriptional regulator with XRE-family HTH domain
MLVTVARTVLSQPHILGADEARFLRKAVLGLTQEQLAKRMGINKVTVADWERGERLLSKEHDYELRGIAFSAVLERLGESLTKRVEDLLQDVRQLLTAPRLAGPPQRLKPYRIPVSTLVPA